MKLSFYFDYSEILIYDSFFGVNTFKYCLEISLAPESWKEKELFVALSSEHVL